jgi:hypothetical protein
MHQKAGPVSPADIAPKAATFSQFAEIWLARTAAHASKSPGSANDDSERTLYPLPLWDLPSQGRAEPCPIEPLRGLW